MHGTALATGTPYDNRFASIATIEDRKIVRWRDYMDSLAAWTALNTRVVLPITIERSKIVALANPGLLRKKRKANMKSSTSPVSTISFYPVDMSVDANKSHEPCQVVAGTI